MGCIVHGDMAVLSVPVSDEKLSVTDFGLPIIANFFNGYANVLDIVKTQMGAFNYDSSS